MSEFEPKTGLLGGRGFYLALALCLAGAGAAALFAAGPAASDVPSADPAPVQSIASAPTAQEVDRRVENVRRSSSAAPKPKASSSAAASSAPAAPKSSAPAASSAAPAPQRVTFLLPADGEVLAPFSGGELVRDVTLGDWRTHNGVDLRCEQGDPVLAPAAGRVTAVSADPLWGTVVVIDHGSGLVSRCCGLAENPPVKTGDSVSAGQPIGAVASAPAESLLPAHLHFEVLENGSYVDPLSRLA